MQVTLNAHPRYLIVTDLIAFVVAAAFVLLLTRVPMLVSVLAGVILVILLGLGFGLDILLWWRRGIRSIVIDDTSLTVFRGPGLRPRQVERRQVARVRIPRRPGRRVAILTVTGAGRLVIAEDAFPREAFARFLSAIDAWR